MPAPGRDGQTRAGQDALPCALFARPTFQAFGRTPCGPRCALALARKRPRRRGRRRGAAARPTPGRPPRAAASAHAQPTPRPETSHAPGARGACALPVAPSRLLVRRMLFRCEGHGQDGAAGAGLSAHQGEPGFAAAVRCSAPRSPPRMRRHGARDPRPESARGPAGATPLPSPGAPSPLFRPPHPSTPRPVG